jgi:hypothetical protein
MSAYLPPGCSSTDIEHGECPECGAPTADGGLCRRCADEAKADQFEDDFD